MNGYIYTKQVSNGTDNCLVLNQGTAYKVPFTFGSDWNHIKIGMFLSFTYTGAIPEPLTVNGYSRSATVTTGVNQKAYSVPQGGFFDDTLTANALVGATVTKIVNGAETVLGKVVSNTAPIDGPNWEIDFVLDTPVTLGDSVFLRFDLIPDGNNISFPSSYTENSGATTKDTFGYWGIISNDTPVSLPSDTNCDEFIGFRFHYLQASNSTMEMGMPNYSNTSQLLFHSRGSNTNSQSVGFDAALARESAEPSNYMGYMALEFIAGQGVYDIKGGRLGYSARQDDPSLLALNYLMAGNDDEDSWGSSLTSQLGTSVTRPSCFFFYNPFFNSKARIHAWAVKKIS